ncbi:MAG: RsiV family protein [Rikenellaceae bacterium]
MVKSIFKFSLYFIAIVSLGANLFSCNGIDNEAIYWETLSLERNESDFKARISYPYRFGGDTTVTNMMNYEIQAALSTPLIDVDREVSIDSMLTALYAEKQRDSVLCRLPYQLVANSTIHQMEHFTSIMLNTYYYTGGANGIGYQKYLNFDNKTGEIVPIQDIINLDENLLVRVREMFAIVRNISPLSDKSAVNMFVDPKDIPFPEQIGFSSRGVEFFYNNYEVAPRSEGTTEVVIPYEEIEFLEIKN